MQFSFEFERATWENQYVSGRCLLDGFALWPAFSLLLHLDNCVSIPVRFSSVISLKLEELLLIIDNSSFKEFGLLCSSVIHQ